MKNFILLLFVLFSLIINAQNKTCNSSNEEVLEDLNSITKCTIKPSKSNKKKAGQISVKVSAPKKRFFKKRGTKKTVKGVALDGKGIENVVYQPTTSEKIKKKLVKTLSSEEIKKAEKFIAVDEVPTFKKCATSKGDERVDCFNTEMVNHINKYFSYPNEAVIKKIQGEVWVRFIIDKEGDITSIKAHGPKGGELLKEEAMRVVAHLPILIPGTKNGQKVSVKYGFPINFSLEN